MIPWHRHVNWHHHDVIIHDSYHDYDKSHVKYPYAVQSHDMSLTSTCKYHNIMMKSWKLHDKTRKMMMSMSMTCPKMCQGSTILTSTCHISWKIMKFHENSWKYDHFWSILWSNLIKIDQVSVVSTRHRHGTCHTLTGRRNGVYPIYDPTLELWKLTVTSFRSKKWWKFTLACLAHIALPEEDFHLKMT